MGSLYKRGDTWWIKYYINGVPKRESASTTKQKEAENFLKQREGDGASGKPILPRADKVRYEEARDDLIAHYTSTGCRGLEEAGYRLKHLDALFPGMAPREYHRRRDRPLHRASAGRRAPPTAP